MLINLRGIRQISFNRAKTEVTLQGGALVSEVVAAAYANDARVLTGNCDCIGALGAVLGGGYGRLMGIYGFGVDNLLSVKLVTAAGVAVDVDARRNADLWWALRGAGPNFGIVTSARMKSYPTPAAANTAWLGPLIYTPDQIEALATAINDLDLAPHMALFMYYATFGPPAYTPVVIALPFYAGTEPAGKTAFASLYALGPVADQTAVVPYDRWNAGSASFCTKGARKPSYGAGFDTLDGKTWRAVWDQYTAFLAANPGTGNSSVLVEAYSLRTARGMAGAEGASFPFRSGPRFQGVVIPWYADAALDERAEAFGERVRGLLRGNSTYVALSGSIHKRLLCGTILLPHSYGY